VHRKTAQIFSNLIKLYDWQNEFSLVTTVPPGLLIRKPVHRPRLAQVPEGEEPHAHWMAIFETKCLRLLRSIRHKMYESAKCRFPAENKSFLRSNDSQAEHSSKHAQQKYIAQRLLRSPCDVFTDIFVLDNIAEIPTGAIKCLRYPPHTKNPDNFGRTDSHDIKTIPTNGGARDRDFSAHFIRLCALEHETATSTKIFDFKSIIIKFKRSNLLPLPRLRLKLKLFPKKNFSRDSAKDTFEKGFTEKKEPVVMVEAEPAQRGVDLWGLSRSDAVHLIAVRSVISPVPVFALCPRAETFVPENRQKRNGTAKHGSNSDSKRAFERAYGRMISEDHCRLPIYRKVCLCNRKMNPCAKFAEFFGHTRRLRLSLTEEANHLHIFIAFQCRPDSWQILLDVFWGCPALVKNCDNRKIIGNLTIFPTSPHQEMLARPFPCTRSVNGPQLDLSEDSLGLLEISVGLRCFFGATSLRLSSYYCKFNPIFIDEAGRMVASLEKSTGDDDVYTVNVVGGGVGGYDNQGYDGELKPSSPKGGKNGAFDAEPKSKIKLTPAEILYCFWGPQKSFRFYTLVPAGVLLGLGAAPMWAAKATYLTQAAAVYAKITDQPVDGIVVRFFGFFFLAWQTAELWGNLVSSLEISWFSKGVESEYALRENPSVRRPLSAVPCPTPTGSDAWVSILFYSLNKTIFSQKTEISGVFGSPGAQVNFATRLLQVNWLDDPSIGQESRNNPLDTEPGKFDFSVLGASAHGGGGHTTLSVANQTILEESLKLCGANFCVIGGSHGIDRPPESDIVTISLIYLACVFAAVIFIALLHQSSSVSPDFFAECAGVPRCRSAFGSNRFKPEWYEPTEESFTYLPADDVLRMLRYPNSRCAFWTRKSKRFAKLIFFRSRKWAEIDMRPISGCTILKDPESISCRVGRTGEVLTTDLSSNVF
ncbi:unnamed protein product, partial [Nesidiocoris tenuis]